MSVKINNGIKVSYVWALRNKKAEPSKINSCGEHRI